MVVADGFAWNGQTYDSLSKVAFAITGTKWNGPRFFGLRDKEVRSTVEALQHAPNEGYGISDCVSWPSICHYET